MRMARDGGRRWRKAALAVAAALPVAAAGLPATTAWAATGAGLAGQQPGRGLDIGMQIQQPLFSQQPGNLFVEVANDGFDPVSDVVLQISSRGMLPISEFGRGWDCSGVISGGGPGGRGRGPGGYGGGPGGYGGGPGGYGGGPGGYGGGPGGRGRGPGGYGGGPGDHGRPGMHGTEPGMQRMDPAPGGVLVCRFQGVLYPGDRSGLAVREDVVAFPGSSVSALATVGTLRDVVQGTSIVVAPVLGGGRDH